MEVCPARVFTFGEKEDLAGLIAEAEQLHPEYKTSPAVYYIGLPKTFIAGSIFSSESRDCLENVRVTLTEAASGRAFTAVTNNYGDFEFEGLEKGSSWQVKMEAEGYYPAMIADILLDKDISLGNIYLQKKR